jgi:electron transfer flavoprotein beta subunit
MKVAVLIKQTPQISEVSFDATGPQWPEASLIVNPFDEYAIEEALRIKEKTGGAAIAICFGKAGSESALRDVLALGIDEAFLIESDSVSGLDPQTAAVMLAAAIRKIGDIDLVLTGKQATDDDSSVVPAALAQLLDWPQIGFVKKIDKLENGKIIAWRTTDSGYDIIEAPTPVVCSVVKEINEPRLPSLKGKMKAKKAEIVRMKPADLGINLSSPLIIKSIEAPKVRPAGSILSGETDEVVNTLIEKLKADQLI